MNKRRGPRDDMVRLASGILVPRVFHDELLEHVTARIPDLKHGARHKAKAMVEPQYYARHDPWWIGGCVADWERKGMVRVHFLGCPYCTVRFYRRT